MGGKNLEVFKFGIYLMFPIGWMYYFGTNLDNRFAVPDFWPKPEESNKIPSDRTELATEVERIVAHRRAVMDYRAKRAETERTEEQVAETNGDGPGVNK